MRKKQTEEEKVANIIGKLICDLRLDLDEVGKYVARNVGNTGYNRLVIVLDSAEAEKENSYVRTTSNPLWEQD